MYPILGFTRTANLKNFDHRFAIWVVERYVERIFLYLKSVFVAALTIGSARNPVQLIGVNAPFQPKIQFGQAHRPADGQARADIASRSDNQHNTRVQNNEHGINQPAGTREQTVWRGSLTPELQRQLNFGYASPQNNGRMQGNQFPQLESVSTNTSGHYYEKRSHHVATAPTVHSGMQLRLIKG